VKGGVITAVMPSENTARCMRLMKNFVNEVLDMHKVSCEAIQ
jgi:hypothetical protein